LAARSLTISYSKQLQIGKEATMSFGNPPREALKVQIRWLIRRDMPEVLDIEKESFEFPWSEENFLSCLRQRNCIGMVAERNHRIVGFMIYELHKTRLHILNFAVAGSARRHEVGTQMVDKLIDKLSQQRRKEIVLEVRETNLAAQLFFKQQGFRAMRVLRNHYEDTTEDAYLMRYRLADVDDAALPFSPRNRISEYGLSESDAA
jgi:ribosomal-protein-alanine N-acetyltransferase